MFENAPFPRLSLNEKGHFLIVNKKWKKLWAMRSTGFYADGLENFSDKFFFRTRKEMMA